MTTTTPVTGQTLGVAYFAVRQNLINVLSDFDLTFEQSTLLNRLTQGAVKRAVLVGYAAHSLKADQAEIESAVDALVDAGLVSDTLALTEKGASMAADIRARTTPLTASLFAGLPADDLAATGRVLATLTERANAALIS